MTVDVRVIDMLVKVVYQTNGQGVTAGTNQIQLKYS